VVTELPVDALVALLVVEVALETVMNF